MFYSIKKEVIMYVEILLKSVRLKKNITLNTLSKMTGISTTHLNDIENNIKSPGFYIMVTLSKALNVDISELYSVHY